MHPYVVIPLLVCVGAAVLASAAIARDPRVRVNWLAGGALAISGLWAFLDVLLNSSPDRATALFWSRSMGFAYLFLAPICFDLVGELRPRLRQRQLVRLGYWASAVLAIAHLATPWFVADVDPTAWGWVYRPGPLFLPGCLYAAAYPTYSALVLMRPGRRGPVDIASVVGASSVGGAALLLPVTAATLTDVILPLLEIDSLRVGATSITLLSGTTWIMTVRAEAQPITSNGLARRVLEILPDGVAIVQPDGRLRSGNPGLAAILGRPIESLVGRPVDEWLTEPAVLDGLGAEPCETWVVGEAARRIPVSLSSTVLRDRQGHEIGRLLSVRDQREMVALRRRLVTSGRMAAVGELAAGIAHEVNNPVAYIQANLNLLGRHAEEVSKRDRSAAADEISERVDHCLEGLDQVAATVRQVKDFSYADTDGTRSVDVARLLGLVIRLVAHRVRHGRFEVELPPLPPVECAEQQLKQVFLDLFLNAARVTPTGGAIRVSAECAGGRVAITVEDEGPAIPADDLARVFEPRTSHDPADEGRALGLSIAYQIMRQHGGTIRVGACGPVGTRVVLELPVERTPEGAA